MDASAHIGTHLAAVYRSTVQPLVATIFRAGKVGPFTGTICFDTARQGLGHAAGD